MHPVQCTPHPFGSQRKKTFWVRQSITKVSFLPFQPGECHSSVCSVGSSGDQPSGSASHPWYHRATVSHPAVCKNMMVKLSIWRENTGKPGKGQERLDNRDSRLNNYLEKWPYFQPLEHTLNFKASQRGMPILEHWARLTLQQQVILHFGSVWILGWRGKRPRPPNRRTNSTLYCPLKNYPKHNVIKFNHCSFGL